MVDNKNWIRHVLTAINVTMFIASIVIISMGIYIQKRMAVYIPDLELKEFGGPYVLVMTGAMLAGVSVLGAQAACSRNKCLLMTYASILIALTVALTTMACLVYSKRKEIEAEIEKCLEDRIVQYRMDRNVRQHQAMDNMQVQLKCCGVRRYTDWLENTRLQPQAAVPDYCCHETFEGCGIGMTSKRLHEAAEVIYVDGCLLKIGEILGKSKFVAIGIGVTAIIVLLIGVLTTCVIAWKPPNREDSDVELIRLSVN